MFGHSQRKAIKARTMGRAEWRALSSTLRRASRNGYTRHQLRAADLGAELALMTGCIVGRFAHWAHLSVDLCPTMGGFHTDDGRYITRMHIVRASMPQFLQGVK